MNVLVIGRSKVGLTLARALEQAGHGVRVTAARHLAPRRVITEDLVVIATQDGEVARIASVLAVSRAITRRTAVVHVAGALGTDVLAELHGVAAGVGQAHPLLSFASPRHAPTLSGAHLLVRGDRAAVARARELARALGMNARAWPGLDPTLYHAAAGLLANGAAALAAGATSLLERGGVPRGEARRALGPLLRSVAENVAHLGLPAALTGPIRRGDVAAVQRHRAAIIEAAPDLLPLFLASGMAQLALARALGDAPRARFDAIGDALRSATRKSTRRARADHGRKDAR